MTPLSLLLNLSGLSQREAGEYLGASPSSIDKMCRGVRSTPLGIIDEMAELIDRQEEAADALLEQVTELSEKLGEPEAIDLGYPADDHEAQGLGLPCVSAWEAMAARVIAASPLPVNLVPRGSTLAAAGAIDAQEARQRSEE